MIRLFWYDENWNLVSDREINLLGGTEAAIAATENRIHTFYLDSDNSTVVVYSQNFNGVEFVEERVTIPNTNQLPLGATTTKEGIYIWDTAGQKGRLRFLDKNLNLVPDRQIIPDLTFAQKNEVYSIMALNSF